MHKKSCNFNQQEVKKSYYAIIPANVRYDKDLPANAKLLYGEITALCDEYGYCWAKNEYFSKLYEVSIVSISKWINALQKKGYIDIKMDFKKGQRYITISKVHLKEKFKGCLKKS